MRNLSTLLSAVCSVKVSNIDGKKATEYTCYVVEALMHKIYTNIDHEIKLINANIIKTSTEL